MAGKVDGIITLTDQDLQELQSYQPKAPIIAIPVGFDFTRLENYDYEEQFLQKPIVYHLGSMDWLPNIQGIKWFIENVLPILINKQPDIEIRLAGKNMPDWIYKFQNKNLIIDGQVPDAIQYQADKAILIVPLLSGGGIRVKIIEGLALGKTIISTTLGATGISRSHSDPILIADDASTFAQLILSCFNSPEKCRYISKSALKLAHINYDLFEIGKATLMFFRETIKNKYI
jgi:polysaccharide biosynthesis protein PslH